jgi:hypothetical protein
MNLKILKFTNIIIDIYAYFICAYVYLYNYADFHNNIHKVFIEQ